MSENKDELYREEFEKNFYSAYKDENLELLRITYRYKERFNDYVAGRKALQEEIDRRLNNFTDSDTLNVIEKLLIKEDECVLLIKENQKLRSLVQMVKPWVNDEVHSNGCEWRDSKEYCDCGVDQWIKEAELVLK